MPIKLKKISQKIEALIECVKQANSNRPIVVLSKFVENFIKQVTSVNDWNVLPAEVTDSKSINQFKNKFNDLKSNLKSLNTAH